MLPTNAAAMKKTFLVGLAAITLLGCQPQANATSTATPAPVASSAPSSSAPATPEQVEVVGAQQSNVQLDKQEYRPGEQITVLVTGTGLGPDAWVGVIPSNIPHGEESVNDEHDLSYFKFGGELTYLVAPNDPGEYDIRLNEDDSKEGAKELASRSFKVVADTEAVTEGKILWTPPENIAPGSILEVAFEAPLGTNVDGWIGVVPAEVPHGDEEKADEVDLNFERLGGRSRGTARLTAPETPGSYTVRMFADDNKGAELGSVTFTVGPAQNP